MSQKFTPLAQSRASYYCKGSPVHFVMVELFRMEGTGATVVTLTFKNLFSRPLVSFTAYFRCKNKYGEVVVEDSFTYDNVYAGEGECFGFDDAVFVSDEPLGSVEVRLGSVTYDDGAPHDLRRCPAVALPALRPLPQRERAAVCRALGTQDADYYPEEAADGWRCTCGAFNYNAGRGIRGFCTAYCTPPPRCPPEPPAGASSCTGKNCISAPNWGRAGAAPLCASRTAACISTFSTPHSLQ